MLRIKPALGHEGSSAADVKLCLVHHDFVHTRKHLRALPRRTRGSPKIRAGIAASPAPAASAGTHEPHSELKCVLGSFALALRKLCVAAAFIAVSNKILHGQGMNTLAFLGLQLVVPVLLFKKIFNFSSLEAIAASLAGLPAFWACATRFIPSEHLVQSTVHFSADITLPTALVQAATAPNLLSKATQFLGGSFPGTGVARWVYLLTWLVISGYVYTSLKLRCWNLAKWSQVPGDRSAHRSPGKSDLNAAEAQRESNGLQLGVLDLEEDAPIDSPSSSQPSNVSRTDASRSDLSNAQPVDSTLTLDSSDDDWTEFQIDTDDGPLQLIPAAKLPITAVKNIDFAQPASAPIIGDLWEGPTSCAEISAGLQTDADDASDKEAADEEKEETDQTLKQLQAQVAELQVKANLQSEIGQLLLSLPSEMLELADKVSALEEKLAELEKPTARRMTYSLTDAWLSLAQVVQGNLLQPEAQSLHAALDKDSTSSPTQEPQDLPKAPHTTGIDAKTQGAQSKTAQSEELHAIAHKDLQDLGKRVEIVEQQVTGDLKKQMASLSEHVESLIERIEECEQQFSDFEVEDLKIRVDTLEEMTEDSLDQDEVNDVRGMLADFSVTESDVTDMKEQFDKLERRLDEIAPDVLRDREQLPLSDDQFSMVKSMIGDALQDMSCHWEDLQNQVDELNSQIQEADQARLKADEGRYRRFEGFPAWAKDKLNQLEVKLYQADLDGLKCKLKKLEHQVPGTAKAQSEQGISKDFVTKKQVEGMLANLSGPLGEPQPLSKDKGSESANSLQGAYTAPAALSGFTLNHSASPPAMPTDPATPFAALKALGWRDSQAEDKLSSVDGVRTAIDKEANSASKNDVDGSPPQPAPYSTPKATKNAAIGLHRWVTKKESEGPVKEEKVAESATTNPEKTPDTLPKIPDSLAAKSVFSSGDEKYPPTPSRPLYPPQLTSKDGTEIPQQPDVSKDQSSENQPQPADATEGQLRNKVLEKAILSRLSGKLPTQDNERGGQEEAKGDKKHEGTSIMQEPSVPPVKHAKKDASASEVQALKELPSLSSTPATAKDDTLVKPSDSKPNEDSFLVPIQVEDRQSPLTIPKAKPAAEDKETPKKLSSMSSPPAAASVTSSPREAEGDSFQVPIHVEDPRPPMIGPMPKPAIAEVKVEPAKTSPKPGTFLVQIEEPTELASRATPLILPAGSALTKPENKIASTKPQANEPKAAEEDDSGYDEDDDWGSDDDTFDDDDEEVDEDRLSEEFLDKVYGKIERFYEDGDGLNGAKKERK